MSEILELKNELKELKNITLIGVKKALTMKDVALLTGLSMSHLYKKCSSKEIPHWKSGGGKLTYFSKEEIEAWMLQNRVKTAAELESEATNYIVIGKTVTGKRKGGRNG